MEVFYYLTFAILAALCFGTEISHQKPKSSQNVISSAAFLNFRNNYLLVYALMMAGDWLQGPYVYALYQHYGYGVGDIGKLFIAGFGSSMIFGTVVGSLGDRFGRKKACLTYVVTYILSCVTKHWSDYNVLMLGRFFGGIATSLLFSAFESWLVCEHFKRGYEGDWLSGTFSKAVFIGNGLVAILSGLLANFLVSNMSLGPVAPFDASATFLALGGMVIFATWSENTGEKSESKPITAQFVEASLAIIGDPKVAMLGAMQSLFEGAMYTFVFLWTPILSPHGEDIPHGFIFATFMLASMVGSSIAGKLMSSGKRVEKYMKTVFLVSAAALFVPVIVKYLGLDSKGLQPSGIPGQRPGISFAGQVQMMAFLVFEVCVGIFWPSMMKMRSVYLPEEIRSTIINYFRIPLNLFVCLVLYNVSSFPIESMFMMCTVFLGLTFVCQSRLDKMTSKEMFEAVQMKEDF